VIPQPKKIGLFPGTAPWWFWPFLAALLIFGAGSITAIAVRAAAQGAP
jgi:hypothetical protein